MEVWYGAGIKPGSKKKNNRNYKKYPKSTNICKNNWTFNPESGPALLQLIFAHFRPILAPPKAKKNPLIPPKGWLNSKHPNNTPQRGKLSTAENAITVQKTTHFGKNDWYQKLWEKQPKTKCVNFAKCRYYVKNVLFGGGSFGVWKIAQILLSPNNIPPPLAPDFKYTTWYYLDVERVRGWKKAASLLDPPPPPGDGSTSADMTPSPGYNTWSYADKYMWSYFPAVHNVFEDGGRRGDPGWQFLRTLCGSPTLSQPPASMLPATSARVLAGRPGLLWRDCWEDCDLCQPSHAENVNSHYNTIQNHLVILGTLQEFKQNLPDFAELCQKI